MGDLKSNPELPVPDESNIHIIARQSRNSMDALNSDQLRGNKDNYICGTDEYGTATDTKAMEENCSPKGICDTFDEFGRTSCSWPQQVEVPRPIMRKVFEDNRRSEDTMQQQDPTDSKDPKCKVFDDCFHAPMGYASITSCFETDCRVSPPLKFSVVSWAPGNAITFAKADMPPDSQDDIGALYVTVELRGVVLSRVFLSSGAGANVMPRRTFDMLGYNQNDLIPCPLEIKGFGRTASPTQGLVRANLKLGMLDSEAGFAVMDIPASVPYNLLLGRPWLCALRAVPSALHQKVKLPFKMGNQDGILTIEGER